MSTTPDTTPANGALCGACDGVTPATPQRIENRPGLSAIAYRVGTHAKFKQSLIAGLSESERFVDGSGNAMDLRARLRDLQTRADDDFTIALLDSFATMADVLTFYQERIANEQYIRTATELTSVRELARLIGYKLGPGVAAEAMLAFTLDDAKGSPGAVTIVPGVKVQSVPGPGEVPQTFETVETVDARAEWNALLAQQVRSAVPQMDATAVCLAGVSTNLRVGDWLLFVGTERDGDPSSERWDFRQLQSVTLDHAHNITHCTWTEGLGHRRTARVVEPAGAAAMRVYTFRSRAALFGATAPDPRLLTDEIRRRYGVTDNGDWPDLKLSSIEPMDEPDPKKLVQKIHLDGSTTHVIEDSWILLSRPDNVPGDYIELFKAVDVAPASLTRFGLAGKTTRVTLDNVWEHGQQGTKPAFRTFDNFIRQTIIFTQSEQLAIAEAPIVDAVPEVAADPIVATQVVLDRLIDDPGVGRAILFRGPRAHFRVTGARTKLSVVDEHGSTLPFRFVSGDVVELLDAPSTAAAWNTLRASSAHGTTTPNVSFLAPNRLYHLRNALGQEGWVVTTPTNLAYSAAPADAQIVSELMALKEYQTQDARHTRLVFDTPLTMVYDRAALTMLANVVKSTHGETVNETAGSGTSAPFQTFALKQAPLTYVRSAASDTGASSSLQVTVNDLRWNEVNDFFGRGPRDRVFISRESDGGRATIEFGDGVNGARPPVGQENIKAQYRKGIGLLGNVASDKLSLLLTKPLGVRSVTNPLAASDAADPETVSQAATNAPPTVLTLGRVVSLQDYEDFARTYVGVGKSLANWTFDHNARGVYVTIAGINGAPVADNSDLQKTLVQKLALAGNARVPVRVHGFRPAYFHVIAQIKVDTDNGFQQDLVFGAVIAALQQRFSFNARSFGQSVPQSEVIAAMQNVRGVIAVDIVKLYRTDQPASAHPAVVLRAQTPGDGNNADAVAPAELLMLDPTELPMLEAMP